jgi:hypothetical protein
MGRRINSLASAVSLHRNFLWRRISTNAHRFTGQFRTAYNHFLALARLLPRREAAGQPLTKAALERTPLRFLLAHRREIRGYLLMGKVTL